MFHQSVTATDCYIWKLNCVPEEQTKAILVWNKVKHDFCADKGIRTIHRLNDFFLIADLGVGGLLVQDLNGKILLDTT